MTLAADITATQITLNTGELPGSKNARIKVLATDGIHTSSDVSDGTFIIGGKSPQAYITYPNSSDSIPLGSSFYLNGTGYDPEEGLLEGTALQWASDKDGYLGEGGLLLVNLSFGEHIITLTATDRDNNQVSTSIIIFVGSRLFLPSILR